MKRILHLITGVEKGGGAENMLLRTLPYLKETENVVCALKGKGKIGKELEAQGIKVYYLKGKTNMDFSLIWKYRRLIQKLNPDKQVNYLIHADFFGRIFGKLFGEFKIISYIRNKHNTGLFGWMDRLTIKFVDFFVFNSRSNQKFYQDVRKVSVAKTDFIPNGLDLSEFKINRGDRNYRENIGLSFEDFAILTVARLDKQKDHHTLFQALALIKNDLGKNFKLVLCGQGKEEKRLKKLATELNLSEHIIWLGHREDVREIMKAVDLFVLPSIHEGMSNALLEAMASELPCIVSNIPENSEVIKDRQCGLTFKVGNHKSLADKILKMYNDTMLRDKYATCARQRIEKKYNIEKIRKDLDNFLFEI